MKTLTLFFALVLGTAASAHAQSTSKPATYPLMAASLDPQQEQARQQIIREQQAHRQATEAQRAGKLAHRRTARPKHAYRLPETAAVVSAPEAQSVKSRP